MSNTILICIEIPAWVVNSDRCFEVPLFSGALATYSNSGIRSNMRACRGFTVSVEGNPSGESGLQRFSDIFFACLGCVRDTRRDHMEEFR